PARAAGLEQRGLEPAAMLVRTFEIKLRGPSQVFALLEHEGMGRAGVEPHVENVVDLLPLAGIGDDACEEALLGPFLEPCIGPFLAEGFDDALAQGRRLLGQVWMGTGDDRPLM